MSQSKVCSVCRGNLCRCNCHYQPCRLFPGEVEDYFCLDCKIPCSALALLVGPHTKHKHVPFDEALLSVPQECLREALELHKCMEILLATEGPNEYRKLQAEREQTLAALAELNARLKQQEGAIAQYENVTLARVDGLVDAAVVQIETIRRLQDMYCSQEVVDEAQSARGRGRNMGLRIGVDSANSNIVALSELRRVESLLETDYQLLAGWKTGGGFAAYDSGNREVGTGPRQAAGRSPTFGDDLNPVSDDEELIRHVLINQERLPHPLSNLFQSARYQAAQGARGTRATTVSSPRRPSESMNSRIRQGAQSYGASASGVQGRSEHSLLQREFVGRGMAATGLHTQAAAASLSHELLSVEQALLAKRKASLSPETSDEEYPLSSTTADTSLPSQKVGAAPKPTFKNPERPSDSVTEVSQTVSLVSGEDGHAKPNQRSSAEPGVDDSSASAQNLTSGDSPSRYLRQFKRVRQCIRDALVADQQPLVTSLLQALHELRREARRKQVLDVERAIALDAELVRML